MKHQPSSVKRLWTIMLLAAGVGFLLFGLIKVVRKPQPQVVNCDLAAKQARPGQWLRLTNCMLDLADAAGPDGLAGFRPPQIYVPAHSLGSTGLASVLVITRSPISVATWLQLQRFKSVTEAQAWGAGHADLVFPHRDVLGIVHGEGETQVKIKFGRRPTHLADRYLVLEEGLQPRLWRAKAAIGIGLVLVLIGSVLAAQAKDRHLWE